MPPWYIALACSALQLCSVPPLPVQRSIVCAAGGCGCGGANCLLTCNYKTHNPQLLQAMQSYDCHRIFHAHCFLRRLQILRKLLIITDSESVEPIDRQLARHPGEAQSEKKKKLQCFKFFAVLHSLQCFKILVPKFDIEGSFSAR